MPCPKRIYDNPAMQIEAELYYSILLLLYLYLLSSLFYSSQKCHLSLNHQYLSRNNLLSFAEKIKVSMYEHIQLLSHLFVQG